jgi:hypothetical protein
LDGFELGTQHAAVVVWFLSGELERARPTQQ